MNLIDQKGGEKVLEANFDDIVKRADNKMIRLVLSTFSGNRVVRRLENLLKTISDTYISTSIKNALK